MAIFDKIKQGIDKAGHGMMPEAELLLFAASRAQMVREKIRPLVEAGCLVILDRFLDSTTVYQGMARGLDLPSVQAINAFATGGGHNYSHDHDRGNVNDIAATRHQRPEAQGSWRTPPPPAN